MFQSARLKLTAWYLLILMFISILFSGVIYSIVSGQVEGLIHRQNDRVQHFKEDHRNEINNPQPDHNEPPTISTVELQSQKNELFVTLIIVNGVIFIVAGGAAYFLARRTLRPIKYMIDEQNQFISSSSHELRTPIATMRAEMETSLLEKHISDKHAREILASSLEELSSLQTLTNKLLNLAQMHNSTPLQFTEEVSMQEVLHMACKKVLPLAKKKNITLTKKIQDAIVSGEKSSLIETFVILLENAVKYSPEKSTIEVTTQKMRNLIKVAIKDQGIGIKEADLPHIFERFYRADKSRNQDGLPAGRQGFGLGLSIAKKTVETHNGSIQVKSSPENGTIFTISLPLKNS